MGRKKLTAEQAATAVNEVIATPKIVKDVWVTPEAITEGQNSRMMTEPNYLDTIQERAVSVFLEGQMAPAEGREVDGTLILDSGFTRREAVRMIREGFDAVHPATGEKVRMHDPERLLWVRIVDTTPEHAFLRGLQENIERKDMTDLQEALAQEHMRSLGWKDAAIARFFHYTNQNRVMMLKKLLKTDEATQNKVHAGQMAASVAVILNEADLTDEQKSKIIDGAKDGDKVRGEIVRDLIRQVYESKPEVVKGASSGAGAGGEGGDDKEGEGEGKAPSLKRSRTDLVKFLNGLVADESVKLSDGATDLAKTIVLWLDGKRRDQYLEEKFTSVK